MVLLRGKTLVKCPKLNEDVSVQNKCVQCPDFKHVGLESYAILIVACKYEETEKPEEPEKQEEEEFEEEG
jgi:hypothetical protein